MRDAEALIVATNILATLLPLQAPRLRLIFCLSSGLDTLAPFDWLPAEVALLNNTGAHAVKGGEYGLMALLMLANRMPTLIADQHERRWSQHCGSVLAGQRLTLLGLGAVGGSVAAHAAAMGMEVTGVRTTPDPHPHCRSVITLDTLNDILPTTDMLFVAMPLTTATRNVVDRRRLELLPPTAGVINMGRGGLLDQHAICDLLREGRLGGAVLDVFEKEPIPAEDRLWSTPNLIITPHMAAADPAQYNRRSLEIFLHNLGCYERAERMPNLFDVTKEY